MKKSVLKKHRTRKILTYFFIFSAFFLFAYSVTTLYPYTKILPCANSISCITNLSGKPEKADTGIFMNKIVTVPQITDPPQLPRVLGESTPDNKHIYVDLTNQRLLAYDGENLVYTFLVSTGKWGKTPTGDFRIWIKLQATRMTGGNKSLGTYYNLPNVPYTMFFYNDEVTKSAGYSLHGAYWHDNFGHPMSHGCVNLRPEDAHTLYDWASPPTTGWTTYPTETNPGTLVTIYGESPLE